MPQKDTLYGDLFVVGNFEANLIKKTGGTSSQFLKADGSVDSTAYLTTTPTLDAVTTAGNTTTNSITVGGLTVDTNTLYVDATNDRIGISTLTPSTKLVIASAGVERVKIDLQYIDLRNASDVRGAYLGYSSSSGQLLILSGGSNDVNLQGGGFKYFSQGNFAIGTTTDAGYKLDVNGTMRVTGVASLSSIASQTTIVNGAVFNADTISFNIIGGRGNNQEGILNLTSTVGSYTPNFGGIKNMLNIGGNFTVGTSATGDVNFLNINPTINYPVGSSGTQRGIYINPTITRATDYRAIETTLGNVLLATTSGFVGIGTTSPSYKLQVVGDIALSGNLVPTAGSQTLGTFTNRFGDVWAGGLIVGTTFYGDNYQTASGITFFKDGGGVERMRMTSVGNFLIGTTIDPGYKLTVNGDINTSGVFRVGGVAGWTGVITIPTNPPGQQNVDVQGGIIVNVF